MLPIDIASATVWQHFLQCQTCHKHMMYGEHITRTTLLRCLLTFRLFLLGLKYCSSVNISSRHPGYCSQKFKSPEASFGRLWRPGDR